MAWDFFTTKELECHHCKKQEMNSYFMENLVVFRRMLGIPMILSSAYRCPEYNHIVSSTGLKGPHTTGRAIDVKISGENAWKLMEAAFNTGFFTGIGMKQSGNFSSRFIHLDDLPNSFNRPRCWTY